MCQDQPALYELRAAFVAEARSWIGTKYHSQGCQTAVKQAGASCGTFIYEAARVCNLIPEEGFPLVQDDWWLHSDDETYRKSLVRLLRFSYEPVEAVVYPSSKIESGSILLMRAAGSRLSNHGGIVTTWPFLVHAIHPVVCEVNATRDPMWSCKRVAVFDPFRNL